MKTSKIITTVFGAALAIAGLGGIPVYALEKDLLRMAAFTAMLAAGIIILGYAAKD